MFGMGMSEMVIILVVALLVVGPDKLPGAAKAIGKGIRDLRRHTHDLQETIEQDENIGGAVRELKSALHGDIRPLRPVIHAAQGIPAAVQSALDAARSAEASGSGGTAPGLGHDPVTSAPLAPSPPGPGRDQGAGGLPRLVPGSGQVAKGEPVDDASPSPAPGARSSDDPPHG